MTKYAENPDFISVSSLVQLFECMPDIHFWIKDQDGRFIAANKSFVNQMGLHTFGQLRNKTDFDVQPNYLSRDYVHDDNLVRQTCKPIENKMEIVRVADGKLKWFSTSKVPLLDNKGQAWGTMGFTRRVKEHEKQFIPIRIVAAVASFINDHYHENITVKQLAGMARLSVVQFERNFRKMFRITPLKYINRVRMKAACKLLMHTNLCIGEIACQTGFRSQSYFTKQFFKNVGMLPKHFRSNYLHTSDIPYTKEKTAGYFPNNIMKAQGVG